MGYKFKKKKLRTTFPPLSSPSLPLILSPSPFLFFAACNSTCPVLSQDQLLSQTPFRVTFLCASFVLSSESRQLLADRGLRQHGQGVDPPGLEPLEDLGRTRGQSHGFGHFLGRATDCHLLLRPDLQAVDGRISWVLPPARPFSRPRGDPGCFRSGKSDHKWRAEPADHPLPPPPVLVAFKETPV